MMAEDDKEVFNVFFREKPAMMLLGLKNAKNSVYVVLDFLRKMYNNSFLVMMWQ